MVRCAEFYDKWREDPNWCEKSPDTVRQIDHYLGLVRELETQGVDTAAIYKKLPEAVARNVLKIKDEKVRAGVVRNTAGMIRRGDRVSTEDIKVWIGLEDGTVSFTTMPAVTEPTIVGFGGQPEPGLEKEGQIEKPIFSLGQVMRGEDSNGDVAVAEPTIVGSATSPFMPASEFDPNTGGKILKPAGIKIVPTPVHEDEATDMLRRLVRGYFTPKQQEVWEGIRKTGQLGETDLEILNGLVDYAGGMLEGGN